MNNRLYTIQEVADILGVSTKTLRRWDQRGRFVPTRTAGNQRRYTQQQVAELKTQNSKLKTNEKIRVSIPEGEPFFKPETPREFKPVQGLPSALSSLPSGSFLKHHFLLKHPSVNSGQAESAESRENMGKSLEPARPPASSLAGEVGRASFKRPPLAKLNSESTVKRVSAFKIGFMFASLVLVLSFAGAVLMTRYNLVAGIAQKKEQFAKFITNLPRLHLPMQGIGGQAQISLSPQNNQAVLAAATGDSDLILNVNVPSFFSQSVGIGTTTVNPSAILDITSEDKGFLAPRMTTAQRDAIATPATSLFVYNTDTNHYNMYNGTAWQGVFTSIGDSILGEAFTKDGKEGNSLYFHGTGGGVGQVTGGAISGTQVYTLPGATGTFITTGNLTDITKVGTIGSGVWNGTTITVANGGTGVTTLTGIVLGNGSGVMTGLTTSLGISGAISDETGTGALVFGTSPAITTSLTTASTTFALINTGAATVNFAGAATTLSIGAATGTTTINNATTAITGALTANGDVTLGDAITDNITFTGRVALDSDLLPIGTTGTNDLGSSTLPWDNLYANNVIAGGTSGIFGWLQRNAQALSPTNITDDFLLGGISTASAKFGILNMAGGNPTATMSSNLSLIVPTGNAPAATFNLLNNGTLNIQRSPGGDAGLATALFIQNNGNVGIGTTSPSALLHIRKDINDTAGDFTNGPQIMIDNPDTAADGGTSTVRLMRASATKWAWINDLQMNAGDDLTLWGQGGIRPITVKATSGNVGIGNTTPLTALDVTGSASLSANLSLRGAGTAHTFNILDNGTLNFQRYPSGDAANNSSVLFLGNNGNVGIGTTSPLAALDVRGNLGTVPVASVSAVSSFAAFLVDNSGVGDLFTASKSGAMKFVITNAGNVGIGNNLPGTLLSLANNGWFSAASTQSGQTTNMFKVNTADQIQVGASLNIDGSFNFPTDAGYVTAMDLPLSSAQAVNTANGYVFRLGSSNIMTIYGENSSGVLANGRVGIGTTIPLTALDVVGSASVSANLSFRTTPNLYYLNNSNLNIQRSPSGDAGATSVMYLGNNGNVGIGNTAPGAMLSVGSSTPALISSAGLLTIANTTDSTSGSTGSINTLGGLGVTKDLAVDGGDIVTGASTFNLLNATATTINFGGAATTLSIGAATGTVTLNNATTAITGALTANGDVTLGNAITDNITFTGRVAQDSDLLPIGTTGTNDLGSSALPWDNLYADNIYSPSSGYSGYWQRNSNALSPTNITDDFLLGATSTASAKFGILNIAGGNPTATMSSNLSLIVPTGNAPAATFNLLNNGTLNIQRSPGGDAGLATALFIQSNGSVGIGNTAPGAMLSVGSSTPTLVSSAGLITVANTTDSTTGSTGSINTLGGLGVTKDLAVDGGDIVTAAVTFNLINATATTLNIGGAATTLSIGAATGTVTLNNATTAITGALTANGDVTLGNAITDNITFTGRVAADSDLIPIGTTGTNDLGSSALPWDNLYANNVISGGSSGIFGWLQRNAQALSPTNITDDFLLGATSTASAKFGILNMAGGNPTATMSSNLSLIVPTGNAPAATFNLLNNGTLNIQRSPGGDAGLATALFIQNNGNVGIGTTSPSSLFNVNGTLTATTINAFTLGGTIAGGGNQLNNIIIGTSTPLAGTFTTLQANTGITPDADDGAYLGQSGTGFSDLFLASGAVINFNAGDVTLTHASNVLGIEGGNVGIGNTAPLTALDVTGSASLSADLSLRGAGTAHLFNILQNGTLNIQRSPGGDAGLATALFIQNNGNVGIGNTAPGAMLSVGSSTPALISSAGLVTIANTTDSTTGSTGSINTLGGLGVTKDLAVDGGDIVTAATTFNLLNATATTVNFAGAATTLSIGAATGTVTLNNATTAITGALTANGDVTLGNAITDNITFTGRVAVDSDLIPIGTTGTNDLGSSALPWDNLYADNIYSPSSGYSGYWQRNSNALSPTNITDDLLLGATSTASAKFGILNIAGGNPTATMSSNLSLIVPTGNAPAATFNLLNNGTLNIQRSPGGDAGLATALFIQNNGNVGIGTTSPSSLFNVNGTLTATTINAFTLGGTIAGGGNQLNNIIIGTSTPLAGTFTTLQANTGITPDADDGAYLGQSGTGFSDLFLASGAVINFNAGDVTLTHASNVLGIEGGNVGIGNTIPLTALDVTGSASLSANLSLRGAGTAHTFNILDNGTLNFQRYPSGDAANNSSVLFLQNNGNVGIGTTAPLTKLDIAGSASASGSLSLGSASGTTRTIGATAMNPLQLGDASTGDLIFAPANTTAMTIKNGGNVGIGTTGPTAALTVNGNLTFLGARTISADGGNGLTIDPPGDLSIGTNLYFVDDAASVQASSADGRYLAFQARDSGVGLVEVARLQGAADPYFQATNLYSFKESGNVGIGNTTPLAKLDVTGSASLSANLSLRGASTAHTFNILDNGTLNIQRSPGGDAGLATALFIQNNGNVGIGTTAPAQLLNISALKDTTFRISSTKDAQDWVAETDTFGKLEFYSADTSGANAGVRASIKAVNTSGYGWATALTFSTMDNPSNVNDRERMRIDDYGNVGIGTTAPTSELYVTRPLSFGATGKALAIFDQIESQDIFTASASGSPKFVITNAGNVGIGNMLPLTALDVTGSASLSANLSLRGAGTAHTFNILDNGTLNFQRSPGGDAGLAANSVLYLGNSGNVGIGTTGTHSFAKLDVVTSATVGGLFGYDGTGGVMIGYAGSTIQGRSGASLTTNDNLYLNPYAGNVGIGNTAPLTALDVTGSASLSANLSLRGAGTAHTFNILDNGTLNFQRSPGGDAGLAALPVLYMGSNGNVGIGTTGPSTLLYLQGAVSSSAPATDLLTLSADGTVGSEGKGVGLVFKTEPTAQTSAFTIGRLYSIFDGNAYGTSRITLQGENGGGTMIDVLNIKSGNVGIGNTAPLTALDVTGSASLSASLSLRGAGTAHTFNILDNGTLNFQRSPGGDAGLAALPVLYMGSNGSVGIGTTAPGAKLHVYDASANVEQRIQSAGTDSRPQLTIINDVRTWGISVHGGDGDKFKIADGTADKDRFTIDSSGNVGIGTTVPTSFLHVDGAAITAAAAFARAFVDNTNAITTNTGATAVYGLMIDEPNITIGTATPTTSASLYVSGAATEATTNYGIQLGAMTGATSTGLDIGALSGTTANKSLNIGAISGTGATGTGITVGNISTTGTTNYGLQLGTMTGGTTSNYQISTGVLTSATTTTNAQLNLGGVVTTGGTTNYGINVGALSGTGTTNYGINIAASTATGTTNYGMKIGAISGAATTNYGLYIDTVSGATSNYAAIFAGGNVGIGTTTPLTALDITGSASLSANLSLKGAGTAHTLNILDNGTLNFQRSPGGDAGLAALPVLFIQNNGNIGIGTTTPLTALDVTGSASLSADLSLRGAGTAHLFNILQNGTLNIQRSPGGDAGLATALFIQNNGNIGIGTTNPSKKLHVSGEGYFTQGVTIDTGQNVDWASGNARISESSYALLFQTYTGAALTEKMRITSAGNVGIGTTAPAQALDVRGNAIIGKGGADSTSASKLTVVRGGSGGMDTLLYLQSVGNAVAGRGIGISFAAPFTNAGGEVENARIEVIDEGSGATNKVGFGFQTHNGTALAERMRIDNAGNVGIGNTTPLTALDVTGSASLSANLSLKGAGTAHTFNILDNGTLNFQRSPGGDAGLATALYVGNNGNVGIGTTTPLYRFDVQDSQTATGAAQIFNTSTGTDADGLVIKLGFTGAGTATNLFETYLNGNGLVQGMVKSNASSGVTYQTNGVADFAEYFQKDSSQNIPFGSVVCFDNNGLAVACDNNSNKIVGVASEHPAFLGGEYLGSDKSVPVGLVGQVRTRVSTANGAIKIGDPLTTSSIPGVAVKATQTGQILGKAIESYDGQGEGSIRVSVNIGWYNPSIYVSYDGTLAGMAATVTSIGDQLALQGQLLASQGESLQAQIASTSTALAAKTDYVLATDPLFDSLNNKVADLQAKLDILSQKVEQQASISAFLTEIQNGQVLGASISAELIDALGDIEIQSATITDDFMVLGRTTVTDLGVTGNINAGLLAINGLGGEINTLSGDLFLQKNGVGGVDILNGKIVIDTTGNMTIAGTVTADAVEANNYTVLGDQSIGSATIPANTLSVEIFTSVASESSKIFLTSTSLTDKQITVVKKSDGEFKVAIPTTSTSPITFDWWIVGNR